MQTYAYRTILAQVGALVDPPVTDDEVFCAYTVDAMSETQC